MTYPLDIPFKKTRLFFLLLSCLGFIGLCLWYIIGPESVGDFPIGSWVIRLVGWVGLVAVLMALFYGIRMIRKNKAAVRIDTSGVHDYSTGVSIGRIDWGDILEFRSTSILGNHFILVDVSNPEEYIARGEGKLAQKALNANHKKYGTPLSIVTDNLKMKHQDLLELLQQELSHFRALPEDLRSTLKDPLPRDWREGNTP